MWCFFSPTPVLRGYLKKTTSVCSMFLCCDYLQKWWMIFIVKISVVLLKLFFSKFLSSFVGYMLYFNKPRGFCPLSFVGSFLWFFFVCDMKWYVFQKQFVRKTNSNSKVWETDFGGGQWRLLTGAKWAVKRQAVPQNPYCFPTLYQWNPLKVRMNPTTSWFLYYFLYSWIIMLWWRFILSSFWRDCICWTFERIWRNGSSFSITEDISWPFWNWTDIFSWNVPCLFDSGQALPRALEFNKMLSAQSVIYTGKAVGSHFLLFWEARMNVDSVYGWMADMELLQVDTKKPCHINLWHQSTGKTPL